MNVKSLKMPETQPERSELKYNSRETFRAGLDSWFFDGHAGKPRSGFPHKKPLPVKLHSRDVTDP